MATTFRVYHHNRAMVFLKSLSIAVSGYVTLNYSNIDFPCQGFACSSQQGCLPCPRCAYYVHHFHLLFRKQVPDFISFVLIPVKDILHDPDFHSHSPSILFINNSFPCTTVISRPPHERHAGKLSAGAYSAPHERHLISREMISMFNAASAAMVSLTASLKANSKISGTICTSCPKLILTLSTTDRPASLALSITITDSSSAIFNSCISF